MGSRQQTGSAAGTAGAALPAVIVGRNEHNCCMKSLHLCIRILLGGVADLLHCVVECQGLKSCMNWRSTAGMGCAIVPYLLRC